MALKNWKHAPLVVVGEMDKAVPSEQAIECQFKREGTHIGNMPRPLRKTLTAECYQRWRGVHAIYRETSIDEIFRHRNAGAAANVEDCRSLRHERAELIEPRAFVPAHVATIRDVIMSVAVVQIDDFIRI